MVILSQYLPLSVEKLHELIDWLTGLIDWSLKLWHHIKGFQFQSACLSKTWKITNKGKTGKYILKGLSVIIKCLLKLWHTLHFKSRGHCHTKSKTQQNKTFPFRDASLVCPGQLPGIKAAMPLCGPREGTCEGWCFSYDSPRESQRQGLGARGHLFLALRISLQKHQSKG